MPKDKPSAGGISGNAPLDSFKLLCVSVISAFSGYIVTWEIVDTKQTFARAFDVEPNVKPGQTYECVIR